MNFKQCSWIWKTIHKFKSFPRLWQCSWILEILKVFMNFKIIHGFKKIFMYWKITYKNCSYQKFQRFLKNCTIHYSRAEQTVFAPLLLFSFCLLTWWNFGFQAEAVISKAQLRAFLSADSTSSCCKSVPRKSAKRASREPIDDKATSLKYLSKHGVKNNMLAE